MVQFSYVHTGDDHDRVTLRRDELEQSTEKNEKERTKAAINKWPVERPVEDTSLFDACPEDSW